MPPLNLPSALEALLFSADHPLPLTLLAESLDSPPEAVLEAARTLERAYAERAAGVQLREIAGGFLLVTAPEHSEWVARMLRGKKRMRLSRAALETMAIIAYKQPVTKSEVEAIRGVDSTGVLATLIERNLVTIRGRSKVVGRPLLYGTTPEFLDYFGLNDLSELPRPEELKALVAAREPEQLELSELEAMAEVASHVPDADVAEPVAAAEGGDEDDDEFEDDEFGGGDEDDDEDEDEADEDEDEDDGEFEDDFDEDDEDDEADGEEDDERPTRADRDTVMAPAVARGEDDEVRS
jgi:segregation and condensation protein B